MRAGPTVTSRSAGHAPGPRRLLAHVQFLQLSHDRDLSSINDSQNFEFDTTFNSVFICNLNVLTTSELHKSVMITTTWTSIRSVHMRIEKGSASADTAV